MRASCEERALAFVDFDALHTPNRLVVSPPGSLVERAAALARPDLFGDPDQVRREDEVTVRSFQDELLGAIRAAEIIDVERADAFPGAEAVVVDFAGRPGMTAPNDRESLTRLAQKLVCDGAAGTVELDWLAGLHQATPPDDPGYQDQWSLPQVLAPVVWSSHGQKGSAAVKVAVIDTGAELRHEDLGFTVDGTTHLDLVDDDTDPQEEETDHGTRVAGIIGAKGNNTKGITGINWSVSMIPIRVFAPLPYRANTTLMAEAIELAVAQGAHIVNGSWGFRDSVGMPAFRTVVCGASTVLLVASAGHGGFDIGQSGRHVYPASWSQDTDCAHVISVAATDREDRLAGNSNYGSSHVDLGAPGERIDSTTACEDDELVDTDADGVGDSCDMYRDLSGTSAAVAHVTGVAALLKAERSTLTPSEIKSALVVGADPLITLRGLVIEGRRLNASGAFDALPPIP